MRLRIALALSVAGPLSGFAAETIETYSAPIRESARQLYWGDTHLHTTTSADAFTLGTRLTREDAYRFARGETVVTEFGMEARLRRPLDFLAVTDHAEYLGVFPLLEQGDASLQGWKLGERMTALMRADDGEGLARLFADVIQLSDPELQPPRELQYSVWEEASISADRWNVPGQFTTFIGYEWTSMVTGDNLHRVVLFRDGAEKTTQVLPFSAQQSTDPEDLWRQLEEYETRTGGRVLAIAHNGNVSNGRMFSPRRLNGEPLDRGYAQNRARWEPIYEVTQVKGDGETHPALSPDDPFADFETWDDGNIALTADKTPEMLPYEYARSALREGLRHETALGTNPFKFGMIGSSDMHTALSTTEEDNYFGKFPHDGPASGRMQLKMAHQLQKVWRLVSSGLAAVWAESNTRTAIFDALERREVYATTGTRIRLRLFAGWDFSREDLLAHDRAVRGYDRGVPMGGELSATKASDASAPSFMVMAYRDPLGANLDRVQMVKGWIDADGQTHEKVYDIAVSDLRTIDPQSGLAPPVGNSVDLEKVSWTNDIGASLLETVWTDPDFDPQQPAFWYLRVLEIPTPRWTAYDALRLGDELDPADPGIIQERAYSSPVWYSPES
ncbi:MAG: DUF3604 domain-containing protein [Pseudomonadota bacterium]